MFDKTGTLTNGKPEVSRSILYIAASICPTQLFLTLVGVAESNSEHPLGQAITNFAKRELGGTLPGHSSDYEAVPGRGLKCRVSASALSPDGEKIGSGEKEMVVRREIVSADKSLEREEDYTVCVWERERERERGRFTGPMVSRSWLETECG